LRKEETFQQKREVFEIFSFLIRFLAKN